jgi:squalene-hopene/tetraprenyl-beta-curcumene cyclase
MLEAGGETNVARAKAGLDWLKPLQVLDVEGDWAEERPGVRPGGWAFQYNNALPDLDDTAVVVMAMDRAGVEDRMPIDRGVEWTVGLQSKNGGWGAFDADNTYDYLNNPFADHGACSIRRPPTFRRAASRCWPSSADRGQPAHGRRHRIPAQGAGPSSWFGRWGVLYLRHLVGALRAQCGGHRPSDPMVARAVSGCARSRTPTAAGARIAAMRSTARAISGALHCRRPPGRSWR